MSEPVPESEVWRAILIHRLAAAELLAAVSEGRQITEEMLALASKTGTKADK